MEGLIPFVYKAIMQYKSGKEGPIGSWICESPSYSYMRLAGDSGRYQIEAPLVGSFSASSPPSSNSNNPASNATHIIVSSSVQSPHQCLTHRRIAT